MPDSAEETGKVERRPLNVKPPGEFSFEAADWEKWKSRFMRFMKLSGNDQTADEDRVNCLLYSMGERAEDIIKRFPKKSSFEDIIKNLDEVFTPKKNLVYERYRFNTRVQKEDEKIESFITDLFKLAETCEYGDLKEGLIRDRIVVGMKDRNTSERMLQKEALDLPAAILMSKQAELQEADNKLLRGEVSEINRIRSKEQTFKKQVQEKCWFCGYERHPREKCPAVNVKCKNCGRTGHYAKLCRSKSMKRLEEQCKEQEEEAVLKEQM